MTGGNKQGKIRRKVAWSNQCAPRRQGSDTDCFEPEPSKMIYIAAGEQWTNINGRRTKMKSEDVCSAFIWVYTRALRCSTYVCTRC